MLMAILEKSFHAIHGTYGRNNLEVASTIINQEFKGKVVTKVVDESHMDVMYFDDNGDQHTAELEVGEDGEVSVGEEISESRQVSANITPK